MLKTKHRVSKATFLEGGKIQKYSANAVIFNQMKKANL